MDFLDAIFSNIFILVAIIAGLSSLFKKNKSEDDQPVRTERPRQSQTNNNQNENKTVTVDTLSRNSGEEEVQIDTSNSWYEQLEESRERREKSKSDKNLDKIKQRSLYNKDRQTVSNISVRKNLNSKRLIESLVMSEVLGQPKAKQRRNY
ncbi:hypothetical protein E3U55_00180 [Filobacillus milosensis]|uniref:Uncharacterized protein n=1 Tax=Filobacillus milosensis TaxID=94137 RepID=A0A4Y8ISL2_9BACI|nr:hypothetical protein [Filobacillus milosensis]TFB24844.1 hypothetical protein E3U55_00180 [Filobacillus milosensis]